MRKIKLRKIGKTALEYLISSLPGHVSDVASYAVEHTEVRYNKVTKEVAIILVPLRKKF